MTASIKQRIVEHALRQLGFDDCRCAPAQPPERRLRRHREWLARGRHGDMDYLDRHLPFKEDPARLLPGVRTAIVLRKNYKNTRRRHLEGSCKVARYAVGRDYHLVIMDKLRRLEAFIGEAAPEARCYSGVDSRPIDERGYAVSAGIGFQGRNTMVIKPGAGSYFFLAVVLTDLDLPLDVPLRTTCGTCRLCLDACPTGALLEDGSMDAERCISYQTIERKTPLGAEEARDMRGWLFGCDICQEVCPFNKERVPLTDWPEFMPEAGVGFDFFARAGATPGERDIPRDTALHRSRKRLLPNFRLMRD